jgi:PDZ domain-containing protein
MVVLGILGLVLGAAVTAAATTELDYFAFKPGPVYDIEEFVHAGDVGELNGDPLMLTVVYSDVSVLDAVFAELDPAVDLVQRERVRPANVSDEEYRERNQRSMEQSKQTALYVALTRLGYDVSIEGEGVSVEAIIEGTGAEGVLEVGDVVTAVNGVPVSAHPEAVTEIYKNDVGDVLDLDVVRGIGTEDETELQLQVELVEHTQEPGRPMVGFMAATYNWGFESPIDVEIDSRNIGGPSAGLMYTLTILDLLSDDDIFAGRTVAGTGTIDRTGAVGSIGGIRQKVVAAAEEGADVVFVPAGNWEQALTAPVDVELVKVETLDDALAWLGADDLIVASG